MFGSFRLGLLSKRWACQGRSRLIDPKVPRDVNCLQPCDDGCFCMAAKHFEDIFFCDCTGRSPETERIYRQEAFYADVVKHPDKRGTANPEWANARKHDAPDTKE